MPDANRPAVAGAWPTTELGLLTKLRHARDDEAWREFVDAYWPLVVRLATRRGLQEADALDAAQSTFMAITNAMKSFSYDPNRGLFRGWIATITGREVERHRRRLKLSRSAGDQVLDQAAGQCTGTFLNDQMCMRVRDKALDRVKENFAPDRWRAFEMVWLEDGQPDEVARHLDRDVQWVYKAKFDALHQLRREVEMIISDSAVSS